MFRDLPHDTKYFKVSVEYFCLYVPQGMSQGTLGIYCPQIHSPYTTSSAPGAEKPLALVGADDFIDTDAAADEAILPVKYHLQRRAQAGQVCCIKTDRYLDILLKDGAGRQDNIDYQDAARGMADVPIPDYTLQLTLEPYNP